MSEDLCINYTNLEENYRKKKKKKRCFCTRTGMDSHIAGTPKHQSTSLSSQTHYPTVRSGEIGNTNSLVLSLTLLRNSRFTALDPSTATFTPPSLFG